MSPYEFHNGMLCVKGGMLYKEIGAISKIDYDNMKRAKKIQVLRSGGGKDRPALVAMNSLPEEVRGVIIEKCGPPKEKGPGIKFFDYLERDYEASNFYRTYTLPTGNLIAADVQRKYVAEASILNAVKTVLHDRVMRTQAIGARGMTEAWKKLATIIEKIDREEWPHSLPKNHRSLQRKYDAYKERGYEALIHGGHGQANAEKLCEDGKQYVLSRWCNNVMRCATLEQLLDEYNTQAKRSGWKQLNSSKTLYNYLNEPEVKALWWAYRYGELKGKEKFMYQHSTKLPSMRDSLWYSDGTKLNLYYKDSNGQMATTQVYEVMDAHSEVFLGYYVSKTEDYVAQYRAFKMACQFAGHRPYEVRFDNQGGHKKLITGDFMSRLSQLAVRTQPYNGKSKTIESAFGRFQSQIMKKLWYFTGQNITATAAESRANMQFIMANQDQLPTLQEAIEAYKAAREEWNQAKHPKSGKSRLQTYLTSENPKAPALGIMDMVDIFWITRPDTVKANAYGITFREKNQKHTYMVYDQNRLPDVEWLSKNIDKPFVVRFDPDDMSLIYLYEKTASGLRLVTGAEPKVEVHRGKQEQEDWEASYLKAVDAKIKKVRTDKRELVNSILEKEGMLPEQYGFHSPPLRGIESKRKSKRTQEDIGAFDKQLSNLTEDQADDIYSLILK